MWLQVEFQHIELFLFSSAWVLQQLFSRKIIINMLVWLHKEGIVPLWWTRVQQGNLDLFLWSVKAFESEYLCWCWRNYNCLFAEDRLTLAAFLWQTLKWNHIEVFEGRRQDGFLAMQVGSRFEDRSFIFGFSADLLELKLLTAQVICPCLCPVWEMRKSDVLLSG